MSRVDEVASSRHSFQFSNPNELRRLGKSVWEDKALTLCTVAFVS